MFKYEISTVYIVIWTVDSIEFIVQNVKWLIYLSFFGSSWFSIKFIAEIQFEPKKKVKYQPFLIFWNSIAEGPTLYHNNTYTDDEDDFLGFDSKAVQVALKKLHTKRRQWRVKSPGKLFNIKNKKSSIKKIYEIARDRLLYVACSNKCDHSFEYSGVIIYEPIQCN